MPASDGADAPPAVPLSKKEIAAAAAAAAGAAAAREACASDDDEVHVLEDDGGRFKPASDGEGEAQGKRSREDEDAGKPMDLKKRRLAQWSATDEGKTGAVAPAPGVLAGADRTVPMWARPMSVSAGPLGPVWVLAVCALPSWLARMPAFDVR